MPLSVNVNAAGNVYARQVFDEMRQNAVNVQDVPGQDVPAGNADEGNVRADGLLTRTMQQICRASGSAHAEHLKDVVVQKDIKLDVDHSDEVDGGASTKAMDDDWVVCDHAFDLDQIKDHDGGDSVDARAQRTMADLEEVTVDGIRNAYAGIIDGLNEDEKKTRLRNAALNGGEYGEVGAKITAAIRAQQQLGEKLALCCLEQDEPDRSLLEAANRSFRCADAIAELVAKIAMSQQDAAPQTTVMRELELQMLPESQRAGREATEKAVRIFDEQLKALNALYGELTNQAEPVTADQFDRLCTELAKAKQMLADARSGGIVLKDGEDGEPVALGGLDEGVLRLLEERLDVMSAQVRHLKNDALNDALRAIYDEIPFELEDSPIFDEKCIDCFCTDKERRRQIKSQAATFKQGLRDLKVALANCLQTGNAEEARRIVRSMTGEAQMRGLFGPLKELGDFAVIVIDDIDEHGSSKIKSLPGMTIDQMEVLRKRVWLMMGDTAGPLTLIDRFERIVSDAGEGRMPTVSGGQAAKVLDGTCGISTAALAGAWQVDVASLEPGIDDRNLISCRGLGSGAYNSVTLCTYRQPDGTTERRAFKPEIPARFGWTSLLGAGLPTHYAPTQQVTQANIAVRKMAEKLGVGDRVVNARPGVHDGQFGLMMEVAEGVSGSAIVTSVVDKTAERVMVGQKSVADLKEIFAANGDDAKVIIGNMRHAMVDLDWLDHIVGQTDRGSQNYMISVGEDLSVNVKGIDNDMCFSPLPEDVTKFPSAISQDTYDTLGQMVVEINVRGDNAIKPLIREWLGDSDLTEAQCTAMADRIKNAYQAAQKDTCRKIADAAGWQALGADAGANDTDDLFQRDVVRADMFDVCGLPGEGLPAAAGVAKPNKNEVFQRARIVQDAVNANDPEGWLSPLLNAEDPPFTFDEFRDYFSKLCKLPYLLVGAAKNTEGQFVEADILASLGRSCRSSKRLVLNALQEKGLDPDNPLVADSVRLCFANKSPVTEADAAALSEMLSAIAGQPPAVRESFRVFLAGSGLNWVSFVGECKMDMGDAGDEASLVLALASEVGKAGFDPNPLDVGRLRRLVINKLRVTPGQVWSKRGKPADADEDVFREACAVTPSGPGYYADVRTKYEELLKG